MKRRIQKIKGIDYVYEDEAYWDSEKQRASHKRKYIGKMIDGKFVPNKNHVLENKLAEKKKRGPVCVEKCTREFYGSSYLLEQIAKNIGMIEDLREVFPDCYKELMSIAFYLVLEEGQAMYRYNKWSLTHYVPSEYQLTSQRISELFDVISEDKKMEYFKLQSKRHSEREYLAFDTTSISSYSKLIKQAKYGLNKDGDDLPQINLGMLYAQKSCLPVYYRKLPGNILDVKTIEKLIKAIDFIDIEKVNLVMDRGFYSESNINNLMKHHHKFLIGLKSSTKLAKEGYAKCYEDMISIRNYDKETQLYIHSFTEEWKYTEQKANETIKDTRRVYVHIYYNEQRATDEHKTFTRQLFDYEEELRNNERNPKHEAAYSKYFILKETPKRGIKIEYNDKAIKDVQKYAGYFALMSNEIKDPLEAIKIYRSKDMIEKAFGNLKERLDMRRMSVSSDESLEGKLFIQFLALSLMSYIKKAMENNHLFKNYTLQSLLDELDIIERYRQPGQRNYFSEITKKQAELFRFMNVKIPS